MLNDRQIQSAIKAVQTEVTLNDGAGGRGTGALTLTIRRTAGGVTALWFAKWKQGGQRHRKALGRYPDMPLALARQTFAAEIRPLLVEGKSPKAAPARTERPTVGRLFRAYADQLKAQGKESAIEVERVLLKAKHNAADALGRDKLASDVAEDDVVHYVAGYFQRGHRGAADKARSYIGSAYTWAKRSANDYTNQNRTDWGIKLNPAADVPRDKGATKPRERALTVAELRALWVGAAPASEGFTLETGACVRLAIILGQRVRETLRIRGAWVDLAGALLNIPREFTKGKQRPHSIPLPRLAVEILRELIEVHGDGPLFPARTGSKSATIHSSSVLQAIDRWRERTGAKHFQTRDIRRTWKTRTAEAGVDRFTRDLIQQHAKADTGSRVYDHADYVPQMRQAMDRWQDWLSRNVIDCEKQLEAE